MKPVYPEDTQRQGDVTVAFWVDSSGAVENVSVIDGDATLAQAAVEAVKQWNTSLIF